MNKQKPPSAPDVRWHFPHGRFLAGNPPFSSQSLCPKGDLPPRRTPSALFLHIYTNTGTTPRGSPAEGTGDTTHILGRAFFETRGAQMQGPLALPFLNFASAAEINFPMADANRSLFIANSMILLTVLRDDLTH